ncbi:MULTISPECIES: hypothetical protein [unclassified Streptomyces]|uniref:hypothetical protein n=1 Tax=unclassified Streptomyces TaxID=2593676 RepID=UPI0033B56899
MDLCRERAVESPLEADVTGVRADHRAVVHEMETHLRLIYVTPAETNLAAAADDTAGHNDEGDAEERRSA